MPERYSYLPLASPVTSLPTSQASYSSRFILNRRRKTRDEASSAQPDCQRVRKGAANHQYARRGTAPAEVDAVECLPQKAALVSRATMRWDEMTRVTLSSNDAPVQLRISGIGVGPMMLI